MRSIALGLAAAGLFAGVAVAQTTGSTPADRGTNATAGTNAPAVGNAPNQSGQAAAAGDNNQAVATTNANAAQPAHGSNSFTKGQAQDRLQSEGFSNVSGLTKDNNGIWRGKAQKSGQTVNVWLDYKGNAGTD